MKNRIFDPFGNKRLERALNPISKTEMLILNATSDDYENLEQIYRSLVLEFSPENFDPLNANSYYWREASDAPSLADVANAIKGLVDKGLMEGKTRNGDPIETPIEPVWVWEGWFRPTKLGFSYLN